ncbi:MAG: hypothetical protein FWE68_04750 [Defluviitaleaceae bacterium]|nr:hypothetical protein [Defluviitaleaceae bacterium]
MGDLAKGYFGAYTEVAFDKNKYNMIKETDILAAFALGITAGTGVTCNNIRPETLPGR